MNVGMDMGMGVGVVIGVRRAGRGFSGCVYGPACICVRVCSRLVMLLRLRPVPGGRTRGLTPVPAPDPARVPVRHTRRLPLVPDRRDRRGDQDDPRRHQ